MLMLKESAAAATASLAFSCRYTEIDTATHFCPLIVRHAEVIHLAATAYVLARLDAHLFLTHKNRPTFLNMLKLPGRCV